MGPIEILLVALVILALLAVVSSLVFVAVKIVKALETIAEDKKSYPKPNASDS